MSSLVLSINSVEPVFDRSKNAVATGLYVTSFALIFNTHAISSRAEIKMQSAFSFEIQSKTFFILDEALSPAYFSS